MTNDEIQNEHARNGGKISPKAGKIDRVVFAKAIASGATAGEAALRAGSRAKNVSIARKTGYQALKEAETRALVNVYRNDALTDNRVQHARISDSVKRIDDGDLDRMSAKDRIELMMKLNADMLALTKEAKSADDGEKNQIVAIEKAIIQLIQNKA